MEAAQKIEGDSLAPLRNTMMCPDPELHEGVSDRKTPSATTESINQREASSIKSMRDDGVQVKKSLWVKTKEHVHSATRNLPRKIFNLLKELIIVNLVIYVPRLIFGKLWPIVKPFFQSLRK